MIIFIVPLRSRKSTNSWDQTILLLERTLISICGQTCIDMKVLVVCNEKPDIEFDSPFVEYISVDLPLPKNDYFAKERDKAKRLLIGAEFAKKFNPTHLMAVDADDLISNKIAALIKSKPDANGYFLNNGYIHESGSNLLYYLRKDFDQYCGTCIIIKANLFDLLFEDGIYQHKGSTLVSHSVVLEKLPFRGGIYSRCNGENHVAVEEFSQSLRPKGDYIAYIKHLLRFRLITSAIKKEFGFYLV